MLQPILPKHKADAISNGAFLMGLAVLFASNTWWPGILLLLWVSVALREYLTGRFYDLVISSIILIGLFAMALFDLSISFLVPMLFILGGIYIIFREFFFSEETEDQPEEILDDADIDESEHK